MKTLSKRLAQGTIAVAFAIGFGAMNTADAKSLKLGLTNQEVNLTTYLRSL